MTVSAIESRSELGRQAVGSPTRVGPLGGDLCGRSYRCAECGYGVTLRRDLSHCPMCAGASWEEDATSGRGAR